MCYIMSVGIGYAIREQGLTPRPLLGWTTHNLTMVTANHSKLSITMPTAVKQTSVANRIFVMYWVRHL